MNANKTKQNKMSAHKLTLFVYFNYYFLINNNVTFRFGLYNDSWLKTVRQTYNIFAAT